MHLSKNKSIFAAIGTAWFGIFSFLSVAHAQQSIGVVASVISTIASVIIELAGKLLIVMIELLVVIVKYNDFLNAPAVERGWILIRDFSNMAFLIIFIAIAYATILGVEKYEWKRLLPKLLLMAVAINFSKTICGLVIDAAQVMMITFVNGFKDVAAGNLVRGLGLSDMLSLRELGTDESVTDTAIAAASILAVILIVVAVIVVGVIVLMFLVRIMYLWILIVLAPIAFLMAATPGAEHLFREWWQKLIRYAFVGPIMAFWLWLSFTVMAGVAPGENLAQSNKFFTGGATGQTGFGEVTGNTSAAISGISRSDQLLSYGISIALLLYSLMVARGMAIKGSSLADAALGKIKTGGIKLGKLAALGVATGGVGSAIGAAVGYKTGKGLHKAGLTDFAVNWADKKYGAKVTRFGGKVLGAIPGTGKFQTIGRAYAKKGTRIKDIVPIYKKFKELKNKEEYSVRDAQLEDELHSQVRGRKTNRAYVAEKALVGDRQKELSEDEDEQNVKFREAIQQMKAGKKGAEADYLAAYFALKKNNGDNTLLLDEETAPEVVGETIRRMGDIREKAKGKNGEDLAYSEAEEEFARAEFREGFRGEAREQAEAKASAAGLDKGSKAWEGYVDLQTDAAMDDLSAPKWEQQKTGIMQEYADTYARETTNMAAEQKKKYDEDLQNKIGTRLYAQKYNVYEVDASGNKTGYAKKIAESTGKDANGNEQWKMVESAHGFGIDENGHSADMGTYGGSADALHDQTAQVVFGKLMKKSNKYMTDDMIMDFSRELDGENLKNNSFGLAMKTVIGKNGKRERVNLARRSGREKHADAVGAKMSNLPASAAAGSHPLTTGTQTRSKQGTYFNSNRPEYQAAFHQAVASNDQRGAASTRNDHVQSLADSSGLSSKKLPLNVDDQFQAIKKFNLLNHPEYGRYPMFAAEYEIVFKKFLNKLGIKGIMSNTNADKYSRLTSVTLSKDELEHFDAGIESIIKSREQEPEAAQAQPTTENQPSPTGPLIATPGSPEFRAGDPQSPDYRGPRNQT